MVRGTQVSQLYSPNKIQYTDTGLPDPVVGKKDLKSIVVVPSCFCFAFLNLFPAPVLIEGHPR